MSIGLVMDEPNKDDGIVLTEAQKRARRSRSIAIAVSLAASQAVIHGEPRLVAMDRAERAPAACEPAP